MVTQPSPLAASAVPTAKASSPREPQSAPRQIPWGYGHDRITATAVDPNQLFVYWELREETIERVRAEHGPLLRLQLRVYDTTGRIFDGSNAHSSFDRDIQRSDRQWFCDVGKPASSAHVEIGLMGADGRFHRLGRSGRVDFPRAAPAAPRPLEWMRVVSSTFDIASRETALETAANGAGHAASAPNAGSNGVGEASALSSFETEEHVVQAGTEELVERFEVVSQELEGGSIERHAYEFDTGWQVDPVDPETLYRAITSRWEEFGFAVRSWESGPVESSWEAGPFSYPTEVVLPSVEHFQTPAQVYRTGEHVRVLHGPWQVVIRGIHPRAGHRVLGRWEVHRSWLNLQVRAGEAPAVVKHEGGKSYVPVGSSERLPIGASELRLRGASEVFFLGASERRLGGASELRFVGASLHLARGASERRFMAASEWRLGGASELRLGGASERRLLGASELRLSGASERRLGASEHRLGGSERRLSGSETPSGSLRKE